MIPRMKFRASIAFSFDGGPAELRKSMGNDSSKRATVFLMEEFCAWNGPESYRNILKTKRKAEKLPEQKVSQKYLVGEISGVRFPHRFHFVREFSSELLSGEEVLLLESNRNTLEFIGGEIHRVFTSETFPLRRRSLGRKLSRLTWLECGRLTILLSSSLMIWS